MNCTPAVTDARPTTLHISTETLPPRDRVEAWCEFSRRVLKYHFEPYATNSFRAEATVHMLPSLSFAIGGSTGSRIVRPRHMVDSDDFIFTITSVGQSRYVMPGREAICDTGDAVLVGGDEGGFKDSLGDGQTIGLQVSYRAIAEGLADLGGLVCRRIPARTPILQLLRHYLGIVDPQVLARPELQRQVATHFNDLVVLALGATRDAAEAAGLGCRSARCSVFSDSATSPTSTGLSVSASAARRPTCSARTKA
jgi:hypothetical protein